MAERGRLVHPQGDRGDAAEAGAARDTPLLRGVILTSAVVVILVNLLVDIAYAALFLASDESTFVNGHDFVVDGAITGGRNWTLQQQGYVTLRKTFGA